VKFSLKLFFNFAVLFQDILLPVTLADKLPLSVVPATSKSLSFQ